MNERKPLNSTEATARLLSTDESIPYYIMLRDGCSDVIVPESELKRHMQLGYKTACAWFKGKRYKNIHCLSDGIHFVSQ